MSDSSFENLGPRWYVAHTYSGYENKVKTNLEKIIENRQLQHLIFDIRIPTETVVEESSDGEKTSENKLFPCYVLVKMVMTDESWHVVRNTSGVTGFVGPGSKPVPLTDEEVEALGVDTRVKALRYQVGDAVKIVSGTLTGFVGVVKEISEDQKKIKVLATMFGRETAVELDASSVEPLED